MKRTKGVIKKDCIMYRDDEERRCEGLKDLYCAKGGCPFYKSSNEYHLDGTRRKYTICEE